MLCEILTEWLCPSSTEDVIGNVLLSPVFDEVGGDSPLPSHPISVIMRGSEKSAPAFRINERLSMIRSF